VQTLKEVARAGRFAAMQPARFTDARVLAASDLTVSQQVDTQAFESAAYWAATACSHRQAKALGGYALTPGQHEARARKAEARVREIALQSEILLKRWAQQVESDRAMLGVLLGTVS